jgi:hypothetical protein
MFHKDYVGVRKLWYATKKENRKTMKNGMGERYIPKG